MMHRRTFLISAIAAAALAAGAAQAQSQAKALVDTAKAQGVVGEQADGLLGFVKAGGDAALKAAVDEINAGRLQLYREAAARNGVTPAAAGGSAFKTVIMAKLKPGEYYRPEGGGWTQK
jgi:uncharacterized protein